MKPGTGPAMHFDACHLLIYLWDFSVLKMFTLCRSVSSLLYVLQQGQVGKLKQRKKTKAFPLSGVQYHANKSQSLGSAVDLGKIVCDRQSCWKPLFATCISYQVRGQNNNAIGLRAVLGRRIHGNWSIVATQQPIRISMNFKFSPCGAYIGWGRSRNIW